MAIGGSFKHMAGSKYSNVQPVFPNLKHKYCEYCADRFDAWGNNPNNVERDLGYQLRIHTLFCPRRPPSKYTAAEIVAKFTRNPDA